MFDELANILAPYLPVVIGLVEWFKLFIKNNKAYPFISMGLGVVFGLVAVMLHSMPTSFVEWAIAVIAGILLGLAASGLFKFGTTIAGKIGKYIVNNGKS